MTWWQGAVLGLVQGLTEFLPISSDGHLDVAKALMRLPRSGLVFDLVVHLGTLCAVFVMYWGRLGELIRGAVRGERAAWGYVALLAIGTVPAGIAGIALEDFFSREFPPVEVGIQFLVTGLILWSTRFVRPAAPDDRLTPGNATLIGIAQAAALFPAVSRSGTTVAAGMWLGMDPVRAGEFSFLLSIPAIAGAAVLEWPKLGGALQDVGVAPLAVGFAVSLVSGIFAIRWLIALLRRRAFHWFAPYCWIIGILVIVWAWRA
jgi:undecaprenyl-diphosphatase